MAEEAFLEGGGRAVGAERVARRGHGRLPCYGVTAGPFCGFDPITQKTRLRYSLAMNSTTSLSVEACSPGALKLKVAAHKAFGWVEDGDQLKVIDYTKRRPTKRYVQMMYRSAAVTFRWEAVA